MSVWRIQTDTYSGMNAKPRGFKGTLFWPWHVAWSALLVPMHIFGHNVGIIYLRDGIEGLTLFLIVSACLFCLAFFATKKATTAGLITTAGVLIGWAILFNAPFIASALGLVAAVIFFINRKRKDWVAVTVILNASLLALLIQPALLIRAGASAVGVESINFPMTSMLEASTLTRDQENPPLPSVIHIVLDGYSSNAVLRRTVGFDNHLFTEQLRNAGFTIFDNVFSPYNQTMPIMSAVMFGNYLPDELLTGEGIDPVGVRILLGASVTRGPMRDFFSARGYDITFTDPGYAFFRFDMRDRLISKERGPFFRRVTQDNAIISTFVALQTGVRLSREQSHSDQLLLDVLENPSTFRGKPPVYVYQHLLAPHPPFTIDRDGQPTKQWSQFNSIEDGNHATFGDLGLRQQYAEGYTEKLLFINDRVVKQIDVIMKNIPEPRIIMIHGDHGSGIFYDTEDPTAGCLNERFSPFLAIYADDETLRERLTTLSSQSFNLVNLYRVILGEPFGLELPLLESRSFFIPWKKFGPAVEVDPTFKADACNAPWVDLTVTQ